MRSTNTRSWHDDPGKVYDKQQIREIVERAIQSLPTIYREAFVVRDVFRQFSESDVDMLEFICRVQRLGFTLKEMRELLELRHNRLQSGTTVRRKLGQKLSQVRQKLADMKNLEHELRLALRKCNEQFGKRSGG